ncbi:MAG: response regulator [Rubrivivax sp.]
MDERADSADSGDRRRAPSTPPAARAWPSWLSWVGVGMLVALVAVAVAQARQFALLRQALAPEEDLVVVGVLQTESDYLQLRERWRAAPQAAAAATTAASADALRQSYQSWKNRLEPLRTESARDPAGSAGTRAKALAGIDAFIATADAVFVITAPTGVKDDAVAGLLPALEALEPHLRSLSDDAAVQLTQRSQQRVQALGSQRVLGVALTVFLSGLTLAFAALSLHQVRLLRRRRQVYDTLADELRQARRDAVASGRAKSAFLANMSHEIRTPFQGLMGMLSLLRETGLNPRQTGYLHTATESADHLLALLNDILDMSQLESGRMTLMPAPLDLRALLREVESLLRPRASAKHLALHLEIDPALPERMLADATRVKQILCNLVSNAIKFSDRGAVVLDAHLAPELDGVPMIEISISDDGIGMDDATVARLFNRFMQADTTTARRHGGSGVGLEIARRLAQLMDGDIGVRSKPGIGSRFTLRLPAHPVPASNSPALALLPDLPDAAANPARRPLQVLVAEDHPTNRQVMAALLESMGHQAHFAVNGHEAVLAAQRQRFDLLLMDLHMPLLDGIGATRAIRALPDPALSTVPIVALTADAFEETRERCLVAGMNDFLTKPISLQSLRTSLRRLFGSAQAGLPDPAPHPDRTAGGPGPAARVEAPADHQPKLVDGASVRMLLQAMPAERYRALVANFLDQGPDTVMHLRAAVRDAQPLELRVNAHAARGAALNLGLSALAATAEALHEGASHLPAHEIARLVQRYETQLPTTRQAVKALELSDPEDAVEPRP